jgi:hypothetical protein
MKYLKSFFDFYLQSSIHVALSCFALVRITQIQFAIPQENPIAYVAFFGTIFGYNFVKFGPIFFTKKQINAKLTGILFLSLCCFVLAFYFFLQLKLKTQVTLFGLIFSVFVYTIPLFPNTKNIRNWKGVKIYWVALTWVGVTLLLPVIEAGVGITINFYWTALQRFLFLFILLLLFDIIDLKKDDPNLGTIPQQIGLQKTKILGFILLLLYSFLSLKVFNIEYQVTSLQFLGLVGSIGFTAFLLFFAHANRSQYYTAFLTESVPIVWWIVLVLFN